VKFYVVTAPESARGIYDTWAECRTKVNRIPGARFQSVDGRQKAEAMLAGGIVLPLGTFAFTDGNAAGGVGVVVLEQGQDTVEVIHDVSTTVTAVFAKAGIRGLESGEAVVVALGGLHNILARSQACTTRWPLWRPARPSRLCTTTKAWVLGWNAAGRRRIPSSPRWWMRAGGWSRTGV
jgi:Caulimovirus viroplasmin